MTHSQLQNPDYNPLISYVNTLNTAAVHTAYICLLYLYKCMLIKNTPMYTDVLTLQKDTQIGLSL